MAQGLARAVDSHQTRWELAHDFVARSFQPVVARFGGRSVRRFLPIATGLLAVPPAVLVAIQFDSAHREVRAREYVRAVSSQELGPGRVVLGISLTDFGQFSKSKLEHGLELWGTTSSLKVDLNFEHSIYADLTDMPALARVSHLEVGSRALFDESVNATLYSVPRIHITPPIADLDLHYSAFNASGNQIAAAGVALDGIDAAEATRRILAIAQSATESLTVTIPAASFDADALLTGTTAKSVTLKCLSECAIAGQVHQISPSVETLTIHLERFGKIGIAPISERPKRIQLLGPVNPSSPAAPFKVTCTAPHTPTWRGTIYIDDSVTSIACARSFKQNLEAARIGVLDIYEFDHVDSILSSDDLKWLRDQPIVIPGSGWERDNGNHGRSRTSEQIALGKCYAGFSIVAIGGVGFECPRK